MVVAVAISVALSVGIDSKLLNVGETSSVVLKLNVVSSKIPAKLLFEVSSIAVAAICTAYIVPPTANTFVGLIYNLSFKIPIDPAPGELVAVAVLTSNTSKFEAPVTSLRVIFPVPFFIFSSKSTIILAVAITPISLSLGVEPALINIGPKSSVVVKLNVVLLVIPAKLLFETSFIAVEAILTAYKLVALNTFVGFIYSLSSKIPRAPETGELVAVAVLTSNTSKFAEPVTSLRVIFPVPFFIFSSKSITIVAAVAIPVASSVGIDSTSLYVGGTLSNVLKLFTSP